MNIVNISAYKFIPLTRLATLQDELRYQCEQAGVLGTILLAAEGINLYLAAQAPNIQRIQAYLAEDERFNDLTYKVSLSKDVPFKKMVVKVKKEIVTMAQPQVNPMEKTGEHLAPETLKAWLDEGRDLTILDTRNDYEVTIGAFEGAMALPMENFREFPETTAQLSDDLKDKPLVMYCTGGIRCEKAANIMLEQGFKEVYQLDGGILNYFEKCGTAHWEGECFVFDDRIAVDANLQETPTVLCSSCHWPIKAEEQAGPCPHCQAVAA